MKTDGIALLPAAAGREKTAGHPFLWLGGLFMAIAAIRVWRASGLPFFSCPFRVLTDLPCPLCGGTRCLLAISSLNIQEAFWLNPLLFLIAAGILLASITKWARRWRIHLPRLSPKQAGWGIAVLVSLNWIYLLISC